MNSRIFRLTALAVLVSAAAQADDQPPQQPTLKIPALEAVTVTASRLPRAVAKTIGDVTVVDAAQLHAQAGLSVAEVLRLQPSIQWSSYGAAGKPVSLYVRGASAGQVLVLIDGMRYGSTTTGMAALEHIPAEQVERVEILRGPAGSLYGSDAIGGVIQIFTRSAQQTPQVTFRAAGGNLGQAQAGVQASGRQDGTSASIGVSHQRMDGVSAISRPDPFDNYSPDTDGYANTSVSVQLGQAVGDALSLGASGLFTRATNHYDSAQYDPVTFKPILQNFDYQNENHNGAGSVWANWQWTPSQASRVQWGDSYDHSSTVKPASAQDLRAVPDGRLHTRQQQLSLSHQWQGRGQGVLLAAEHLRQSVDASEPYVIRRRNINSLTGSYTASHGPWDVQANLRRDDNSQYGRHTTGLLGLAHAIWPGARVGAQYATAFRAPTFNDLYVPWGGSPTLKPEKAKNTELFLQHDAGGVHARLSVFENRINDLIIANSKFQLGNLGQARLRGVSWRTDWTGEGGWLAGGSFDYLQPQSQSPGSTGRDLPFRARHSGTGYVGYGLRGRDVRLEAQGVGSRYSNLANTQALPGYGLLNLTGRWALQPRLSLDVRVNNLLDKAYETIPYYGNLGVNGVIGLTWNADILSSGY